MVQVRREAVVPSQDWQVPATIWTEVVSRYVTFIEVPGWRVSVKPGGGEKRTCYAANEATALGEQMLHSLDRVLSRQPGRSPNRKAKFSDLVRLHERQGRHIPRDRRCSKKIGTHIQRAFLFNAVGYRSLYCRRTAWGVYAEETIAVET